MPLQTKRSIDATKIKEFAQAKSPAKPNVKQGVFLSKKSPAKPVKQGVFAQAKSPQVWREQE